MYNSKYEKGMKVYSMWDDILEITHEYLFCKLQDIGCEIDAYKSNSYMLELIGYYPHDKIVKIKKFFNDEYPCVDSVEPTLKGIRIYFKIKISVNSYLNELS